MTGALTAFLAALVLLRACAFVDMSCLALVTPHVGSLRFNPSQLPPALPLLTTSLYPPHPAVRPLLAIALKIFPVY